MNRSARIVENAVCLGCGCACDDIAVVIVRRRGRLVASDDVEVMDDLPR